VGGEEVVGEFDSLRGKTMSDVLLVYFDLDGVIFDFDRAYSERIGVRKPNGDVYWDKVSALGDFFESVPLMPGALDLWNAVPAHRRRILSSIPKSVTVGSNAYIGERKRAAVRMHLVIPDEHVIFVRGKRLKKAHASPGRVLVDDRPDNVRDWNDAGGIGILCQSCEQALVDLMGIL
jgi:hypothetical protein